MNRSKGIKAHPARFPAALPEYFIRMVTDPGDLMLDPFGGICVTGEVAERLRRRWICAELVEQYLEGALGRFEPATEPQKPKATKKDDGYYRIAHPGLLWNGNDDRGVRASPRGRRPATARAHAPTDPNHEQSSDGFPIRLSATERDSSLEPGSRASLS